MGTESLFFLRHFLILLYIFKSLFFVPQTPTVNDSTKPELFHFLKVVASEELDKLDTWDSEDSHSEGSDIDETAINISPFYILVLKKPLENHLKHKLRKLLNVKELQEVIKLVSQDGDGVNKYLQKMEVLLHKKKKNLMVLLF